MATCELVGVSNFDVRPIDKAVARELIVANHYSHNWATPFGTYCFGLFDEQGLAGALAYGYPMNPESYRGISTLPKSALTELNRMWVDDRLGRNTESAALSRSFKWLREHSPVQLVQTFADGRLGVGTVYKAANFTYYGHSETTFFNDAEAGSDIHGTAFTDTRAAAGMVLRNHKFITGRLAAFKVKTYRYLYPLNKRARKAIKLAPKPYPAYERGITPLPDYVPPVSQIARCLVIADALCYRDMATDFDAYMAVKYQPDEITEALKAARVNEWITPLIESAEAQPDLFGGAA